MSRFNNNRRLDIITFCLERDGPICQGIVNGKRCLHFFRDINEIEVDHVNGNPHYNPEDGSNWRIVCRSCNWHLWLQKEKERLAQTNDNQSTLQTSVCVSEQKRAPTLAEAHALAGEGGRVVVDGLGNGFAYKTAQDIAEERKQAEALQAAKEDAALTPVMRVNKRCEKPFNEWMNRLIQLGWKYDYETWANAGAQEFTCSPETIKKYLNKRTNPINGDLYTKYEEDAHGNKSTYLAFRKEEG